MNRPQMGRQKLARFLFRGGRARRAPGTMKNCGHEMHPPHMREEKDRETRA